MFPPVYHYFHFCFLLLASDTQSSYSDYTSLSNDDHDPRYEHDNSAGIIIFECFYITMMRRPAPIQLFYHKCIDPFSTSQTLRTPCLSAPPTWSVTASSLAGR